jgi:ribosomal protein L13E
VQRYRCETCKKTFSAALFQPGFWQKKRQKNEPLARLLCSGVSQRRAALILFLNRKTVERKLHYLAFQAELEMAEKNQNQPKAKSIEFDDLETFEHSKCKPLSVTLAVESKSRRILGLKVSSMRAKGLLTHKAKKYGFRLDNRRQKRGELFEEIRPLVEKTAIIKSDSNPYYLADVRKYFPDCDYKQFLGKRGSLGGQGELKKVKFDPLFSLNHTCAKLRADINRLVRKTWCTTKKAENLQAHLVLYANFHNNFFLTRLSSEPRPG